MRGLVAQFLEARQAYAYPPILKKNHYFVVVSLEYHNVVMEIESNGRLRGKTGDI